MITLTSKKNKDTTFEVSEAVHGQMVKRKLIFDKGTKLDPDWRFTPSKELNKFLSSKTKVKIAFGTEAANFANDEYKKFLKAKNADAVNVEGVITILYFRDDAEARVFMSAVEMYDGYMNHYIEVLK